MDKKRTFSWLNPGRVGSPRFRVDSRASKFALEELARDRVYTLAFINACLRSRGAGGAAATAGFPFDAVRLPQPLLAGVVATFRRGLLRPAVIFAWPGTAALLGCARAQN